MSKRQLWFAAATSVTALLLILSYHFARRPTEDGAPLMVRSAECACALTPGDPHDPAYALNFGRYTGQCIDNCKYRSVAQDSTSNDRFLVLVNVREGEEYWNARVDLQQLTGSEILFQNFTSIINHVAIGFDFASDKAITLTPQSGDLTRKAFANGLVLSAEGAPAKDRDYTLADGMAGRYAMVYRASTLKHYRAESAKLGFPLKEHNTNLDLIETSRLLALTLEYGRRESFRTVYQLLFNNCATTAVDLMRMARDPSEKRLLGLREYLDLERGIPATVDWGTVRRMRSENFLKSETTN